MKKLLLAIVLSALALGIVITHFQEESDAKHIGIIVPMEHKAMELITLGLREAIQTHYSGDIFIDVQNAKGDRFNQKNIIEHFKDQEYDVVIPIGTDVAIATAQNIKDKPILALDISDLVHLKQDNLIPVFECSLDCSYRFIKTIFPKLKKITFVHSISVKNSKVLENFIQMGVKDGVSIKPIEIQSITDLYIIAKKIDSDSDVIFISKDHLAANGATLLSQAAIDLQIPLIASDEGSVINGAAVAFGNKEINIGHYAGKLAVDLLCGISLKKNKSERIDQFLVFLNEEMATKQGLNCNEVMNAANILSFPLEIVGK